MNREILKETLEKNSSPMLVVAWLALKLWRRRCCRRLCKYSGVACTQYLCWYAIFHEVTARHPSCGGPCPAIQSLTWFKSCELPTARSSPCHRIAHILIYFSITPGKCHFERKRQKSVSQSVSSGCPQAKLPQVCRLDYVHTLLNVCIFLRLLQISNLYLGYLGLPSGNAVNTVVLKNTKLSYDF